MLSARRTITVVIPTLNEEEELPETVNRAFRVPEVLEVIVADGGSSDRTVEIAEMLGCDTIACQAASRGGQIRKGCESAKGEILLLLHADTWLRPDAGSAIDDCLANAGVIGGGFWKEFRGGATHWLMRGSRVRCWLRLALFNRLMGDQAIFCRSTGLEKIGGFPDVPLMEELEFCKSLLEFGDLRLANSTVTTSARKYRRLGVARTYLLMWEISFRHLLGESTQDLYSRYYPGRSRPKP